MEVQHRTDAATDGGHALTMVGLRGATWHLELVADTAAAIANPAGPQDLLVLYLANTVPEQLVERIVTAGGRIVEHPNPYWGRWGVTIADPDGYMLVLCTRDWTGGR